MNALTLLICTSLSAAALGQEAGPPPRKDPFAGFGNTSLDRPARGTPASPGNSRGMGGGGALDQRPSGLQPAISIPAVMPGMAHGFRLEVRSTANGGSMRRQQGLGTDATGFSGKMSTVSRDTRPVLDAVVHNVAHQSDSAHLEWYFIGRSVINGAICAWDQGEREMTVPAAGTQVAALEARPLVQSSSVTSRSTSRPSDRGSSGVLWETTTEVSELRDGSQGYGWIVRLFVAGKLVQVEASSHPLQLVGWNQSQLDALLPPKPPAPGVPVLESGR